MHAPHRLSFFLAVGVWLLSSLWWGGEQLSRVWGLWPHALSPSVVHGTVMVFGAMPLFFAGFLFTAGPKWLGVEAPSAHQLRWPLGLQAVGWSLWLLGAHHAANVSLGGLALAWLGLGWVQWRFGRLWHASRVPDRLHAQWLMGAGVWGGWVLRCTSQLLGLREEAGTGVPALGLGALHAMTMGCFGSLVLAMVTRVACGHGGRPLVADNAVWALFWGLQLAVLLRLVASVPAASPLWMLAAVAVWCAVLVAWGVRLMGWMGQPRADGRPG